MLLANDQWASTFHPHLQELLNELEQGLGKALRQGGSAGAGDNLEGIIVPLDEFNFWADGGSRDSTKLVDHERAKFFHECFSPLRNDFTDLTSISLVELVELLDRTQDALDDVWKQTQFDPPFPLARMQHLLSVMGTTVAAALPKKLGDLDVWQGNYSDVRTALRNAASVCKKWSEVCMGLTATFWKSYERHPWTEAPHVDERVNKLGQRIEEVLNLRSQHEQLVRLLTGEEQEALG